MFRFIHLLLSALCLAGSGRMMAATVKLEPVEASTPANSKFAEAVDGIEAPENGWVVPQSEPQSGVFRCVPPMPAGRVRLWLVFNSGRKDGYFGEFSFSVTTDPKPSATSHWSPLFPVSFNSENVSFERAYTHLRAMYKLVNARVTVDSLWVDAPVTGIRIETWPTATGPSGEGILSEVRMERLPMGTTNIALGCPVTASHDLPDKQYPEFLTDGLSGSYAHPSVARVEGFYFQVDLRRTCDIDHIALRSRAQSGTMGRFTHLHLQLFAEEPNSDSVPVWTAQVRQNGSIPEPGTVDVIRSTDGDGNFRGRYLRISSTSPTNFSPELAEVEVYESIVAPGVQVRANDQTVNMDHKSARISADANWLNFTLQQPPVRDGLTLGWRWRIVGFGDNWSPANPKGVVETRGLPPGHYLFEAQLRHTDFEWNGAPLRVPLVIVAPWWQKPAAQWVGAVVLAGMAALLAWWIARRRLASRLAELERRQALSRERARIARNMHDVVGARLTQLALLHELVSTQQELPESARGKLHELSATAREAVSAMDEAVWAVNPRNDSLQNVADYLSHTTSDYVRPLEIGCRLHLPETWPEMEVGAQKRHELLLAFKEALHNVVKHAGATRVILTLNYAAPNLVLWLDDNGRGLPDDTTGAEKDGLLNMEARLAAVGGTCRVANRPEGGTRVEMIVPIG